MSRNRYLARYLPISRWGRNYNKEQFTDDTIAAIIVAIMLIPQGLAYALVAGMPPEAGLYASIFGLTIYALFGTSNTLSVAPVAVISLMTAAALGKLSLAGTADYVVAALILTFLSGVFLLLLGLLRLGFMANFLSHPVISAFITASAIIIGLSQLQHLLGVTASGHNFIELSISLFRSLHLTNFITLSMGLGSIILIVWCKSGLQSLLLSFGVGKRVATTISRTGPVFAVTITSGLAYWFRLDQQGVQLLGAVPAGLPGIAIPDLSLDLVNSLLGSAVLISIIGFVESISVAQTLAAKKRERIDLDQELVGLGAANITVSFTGGFPVSGGFSRSKVNFDAGAATPRLLKEVASGNAESQDLVGKMTGLIEEGEDKRQENRKLNLELQHSLQRNQQQREDLVVLTSECRETGDTSLETQSKHEASIRGALEQLSVALAANKQSKFQIDRVLKDLLDSNGISSELIERMTDLSKDAELKQSDNGRLNTELEDTLARSISCRDDLVEIADDCRVVRDKTKSVLEASEQINEDSRNGIAQLNEHIDSVSITKLEMNGLIETAKQINNDTSESLDSMRTNINNSSLIQKESMRLNKESVATTLGAKRATEKLTEELDASLKLNENFQDRLRQAEKKYLNAIAAEKKYQEMHESGLRALQENEALLAEARASLDEFNENTTEYNSSVKQFQQTTVQSQQVILETQESIKALLNSNEALSEENRFLQSQLNERSKSSPSNVLTMPKSEKQSQTVAADEDSSQLEKYGIYRSDWQLES